MKCGRWTYWFIHETQTCSDLAEGNFGHAVFCIEGTNPVAVVTDLDDGLVLPQVPYNCFPTGVDRGQDVLNLPVPGHNANVFSRLKEEKKIVKTWLWGKQIPDILMTIL